MDVGVQIPLRSTVRAVGQMPRSGVAARSGNSSLSFLRNPHTVCHSSCPSLHAPQQCARVATAAHPHQHSSFFCVLFFLVAMVMGGSCWERGRVATGQLSAWDTKPWGPHRGGTRCRLPGSCTEIVRVPFPPMTRTHESTNQAARAQCRPLQFHRSPANFAPHYVAGGSSRLECVA